MIGSIAYNRLYKGGMLHHKMEAITVECPANAMIREHQQIFKIYVEEQ
jgi:hypothetical protein